MKQVIISIVIIAISIIVWLHWGGFSNDLGTLIIALADVFAITVVADNSPKKSEKSVKD
jgi:F0F1-type ATP synthase assembly protein I